MIILLIALTEIKQQSELLKLTGFFSSILDYILSFWGGFNNSLISQGDKACQENSI